MRTRALTQGGPSLNATVTGEAESLFIQSGLTQNHLPYHSAGRAALGGSGSATPTTDVRPPATENNQGGGGSTALAVWLTSPPRVIIPLPCHGRRPCSLVCAPLPPHSPP